MFWFAEAAEAAHGAAEHAEEAEHHAPIIVQLVNHWFGEPALQVSTDLHQADLGLQFLAKFGTNAEVGFWSLHAGERDSRGTR